jgi:hypothetical protein
LNEPDEDLESTLPEEPLPERDVLLEALVDAETESTTRRRFSKTLIAACILSGLGIWQIVHVSNGGEPIFQLVPKPKAAPTKQRSEGRESIGRVLQSTDPIAAYLERAKRGMTDQEIRWMIEDFQTAGLDEEDHSLKGTLRAKQQLWYLEALTEALQLSPDQRAQAKAKMAAMLATDVEAFEKGIAGEGGAGNGDGEPIGNAILISPMADAGVWLLKDAYAPWNLCDLTKEQDQLTMHRWRKLETDSQSTAWLQFSSLGQDPKSGNLVELADVDPRNTDPHFIPPVPSLALMDAFPLTPDQKYDRLAEELERSRRFQSPQLRLALLTNRGLAVNLVAQLDESVTASQPHILNNETPGIIIEKPEEPNAITPTDELPPNLVEPETPVDPVPEPDPK